MTGFKSKKTAALDEDGMYLVHHTQPEQELTLQEQLEIANVTRNQAREAWSKAAAESEKVYADFRKAGAACDQADAACNQATANLNKAAAELQRIKNLMDEQND